MIIRIIVTLFLFLGLGRAAFAYEVVVLHGAKIKPYLEVSEAFTAEFARVVPGRGLKSIEDHVYLEIFIDQQMSDQEIESRIKRFSPDLILALGQRALVAVQGIRNVPVIYLLASQPEKIMAGHDNITGVSLFLPPKLQFKEVRKLLPQVKRVGVIYNPGRSAEFVMQMRQCCPHFTFIKNEALSSKDVPALLDSIKGKIDLLWMLPDATIINPKTLKNYFLFSFKQKVPVLTFSSKYLQQGAALAVTFDLSGLGRQAADISLRILQGEKAGSIKPLAPTQSKTYINYKIFNKLNVPLAGAQK
ncbi:MAG: hypothetical protein KQH63_18735 [Desulfobulbaceae bacterium]|nr:hypothetical protein [Desulfobulbaceae bacterium]